MNFSELFYRACLTPLIFLYLDALGFSTSPLPQWSSYPGSGHYPGYDNEAGLGDLMGKLIDWFRRKNCTPWENDGDYYYDWYTVKGVKQLNVLESIGPIVEVVGGPIAQLIHETLGAIPGASPDVYVWNVSMSLKDPYAYEGMPCRVQTVYVRKCKRTCCRFGKRRPQTKKVKASVYQYGEASLLWGSRTEMTCNLYYDPPDDVLKAYLEQATDCSQLNK